MRLMNAVLSAVAVFALANDAASARPTATEKCRTLKMKQIGKYGLCRTKADAKAIKKGTLADYTKCDIKLAKKFSKIEEKFVTACPTIDDLIIVTGQAADCTTDWGCLTLGDVPPLASVLAMQDLHVSASQDLTVVVQNSHAGPAWAYCVYIPDTCGSNIRDFHLYLDPGVSVEWSLRDGAWYTGPSIFGPKAYQAHGVGPWMLPFTGDLVCIEITNPELLNETEVSGNHLRAWTRASGGCPDYAVAIQGLPANNQDGELIFGTDYDPCPPEVDPNVVETCWSFPGTLYELRCQAERQSRRRTGSSGSRP